MRSHLVILFVAAFGCSANQRSGFGVEPDGGPTDLNPPADSGNGGLGEGGGPGPGPSDDCTDAAKLVYGGSDIGDL